MTRDKLRIHAKAALLIARETAQPLDVTIENLMHWIDEYHATA